MSESSHIATLIYRHLTNELAPPEQVELESWVQQSEENKIFFHEVSDAVYVLKESTARQERMQAVDVHRAWEKLRALGLPEDMQEEAPATKIVRFTWWRYAAAAVGLLLMVSFVIYYFVRSNKPATVPVVVQNIQQEVKPRTQAAYLTLDNGQTILLDSATGLLATQGSTQVAKDQDGVLRYTGGKGKEQKLIYNTVTVPRGSDVVYLQLADGSKVWLNAESSIRYPVAFIEEERRVEITGEAYFEVSRSLKKRFIVSNGGMNVVVLGTRFNVNAYANEANIKVTLLEGSVKVQLAKAERLIKPGQQAVLSEASIDVLNDVDLEQVMAWKEGKFVFSNTNIQLIMRQMERWYDLEPTRYESKTVKQWEFNGEISRYNNASKVLQLLEKTGSVKFTVEGKKITVKPL
ncbi:FecR family protein [Longitalea arenae]|uniref:FecR family protein n=1 Tax=Longitalea arenae TaxID=2812558 RepID=UPI0019677E3A|nr:FecR family protein [Longitalea arenae]